MNARELLEAGRLSAAIEALNGELKARPNDLAGRTILFDLLCYAGDLTRAERQLDVIGHQSGGAEAAIGVRFYQNMLAAEKARTRLFAEGVRPRFLLEPPLAVSQHLEALDRLREGRRDESKALLDGAAATRTPIRGVVGGGTFDDFRDADDLLAPVLEVFTASGYFWVPWEQVQFLQVPPPRNLRDLLWTPAQLASFDGQLGEVFLPALYPGSGAHADDLVRLGRKTEWLEPGAGIVRGAGRKLFLVGDDARSLPELGELQFDLPGTVGSDEAAIS
jgi:type VI secretion system protein ImpE